MEQLSPRLQWLGGPIAQATVLRSLRLKTVADLMKLMASPVAESVREDIECHNCLVQHLGDLEQPVGFVKCLNTWETRAHSTTGHWAIAMPVAWTHLRESARFTFLKQMDGDGQGHRYFHIVGDREADGVEDGKLTLWHLRNDHFAWLGSGNANAPSAKPPSSWRAPG